MKRWIVFLKQILTKLKSQISYKKVMFFNYIDYINSKELLHYPQKAKCTLVGTPSYGNLGDQLIAVAEMEFLRSIYGNESVFEVSENDVRYRFRRVKKYIKKDMTVYLQGGGNISDIWTDQEKLRKKIIKSFDNKMIVFPQTVFFSNNICEHKILNKYKDTVTVCAREKYTYELLKKNKIKTYLCPDMAFYLKKCYEHEFENQERYGIGVCIRNDFEKSYINAEEQIFNFLKDKNYEYEAFTTVIDEYITKAERKKKIDIILKYISGKELIITDRLHAMIMAYLTNTPCISLANQNKKVEGTYEWIKNVENIYFTKNLNDGLEHINQLISQKNHNDFSYFENYQKITGLI